MWIARDENIKYVHNNTSNHLWLYITDKPIRMSRAYNPNLDDMDYTGCWLGADSSMMPIDDSLFPELKWEDEPQEVCLCVNNEKYHTVKVEVLDRLYSEKQSLEDRIEKYNSLPWYKRIFKKV